MPRYVALLRAVNVGGKNKVPMADLRDLFESMGHSEVSTFIQSGNVIFSAAKSVTPKSLETAISKRFHVDTTVVLRTPGELEKVVKANPFPRRCVKAARGVHDAEALGCGRDCARRGAVPAGGVRHPRS